MRVLGGACASAAEAEYSTMSPSAAVNRFAFFMKRPPSHGIQRNGRRHGPVARA